MYGAALGLRALAGVMRPPRTSCASRANESSNAGLSGLPASPSASALCGVLMSAKGAAAAATGVSWLQGWCCSGGLGCARVAGEGLEGPELG